MTIEASGLGRRFKNEWIFRNLDYSFKKGRSYAITGPNGSGKSTLLKILSGLMPASEGSVKYHGNTEIPEWEFYRHLVISAPYLELVEELNLEEFLDFHFKFKPIIEGKTTNDLIEFCYLEESRSKPVKNFSSGMKQRLKLAICFYSDVPVVLLDEPTTNLDEKGIAWYHENHKKYLEQRLVITCSNIEKEYSDYSYLLNMQDFK